MAVTLNANTSTGFIATSDTSGVLQLQTAGTTALTVDASANVGIGTASPASDARLTLASPTTESYVMFSRTNSGVFDAAVGNNAGSLVFKGGADSATVAGLTEFMRIDSTGNVGIGTSSPSVKLEVNSASNPEIRISDGTIDLQLYSATSTSSAVIGTVGSHALLFRTNAAERMRIDSSGNLLVGTTSTINSGKAVIDFQGGGRGLAIIAPSAGGGAQAVHFYAGGTQVGNIAVTTTTTSYGTSSDYRLKHDIAPMTGALAKVALLKPVTYKWNADDSAGEGFIAHELQEVCPSAVTGEKDAVDAEGNPQYQGIDTSFLVATLTAAIQEQQAIITQLQADVAALKGTA